MANLSRSRLHVQGQPEAEIPAKRAQGFEFCDERTTPMFDNHANGMSVGRLWIGVITGQGK